jgi:hypothetical protein
MKLVMHAFALRLIHSLSFCGRGFESAVGAPSDGGDHLQIPEHLLDGTTGAWRRSLALGF